MIVEINYPSIFLNNTLYRVIDDKALRHKLLKSGEISELNLQLDKIRKHRDNLEEKLVQFCKDHFNTQLSPLDHLYVNCYFDRILNIKLGNPIISIICIFLGIPNTHTNNNFNISKLYMPSFWHSISIKLKLSFPVEIIENKNLHPHEIPFAQSEVLQLLKIVFYFWSGSELKLKNNLVYIEPAIYIRLVEHLKRDVC